MAKTKTYPLDHRIKTTPSEDAKVAAWYPRKTGNVTIAVPFEQGDLQSGDHDCDNIHKLIRRGKLVRLFDNRVSEVIGYINTEHADRIVGLLNFVAIGKDK